MLILCILESEVMEGLEAENLIEFLKGENRNLMVFADSESRKHVRKVANSLGVDFENYVRIFILGFLFLVKILTLFTFLPILALWRKRVLIFNKCGFKQWKT